MAIRFSMKGEILCSGTDRNADGKEEPCGRGIQATLIVLVDRPPPTCSLMWTDPQERLTVDRCVPVAAELPEGWRRLERPHPDFHTVCVFCPEHAEQADRLASSWGLDAAERHLQRLEKDAAERRDGGT